jgi:hypothetical protein
MSLYSSFFGCQVYLATSREVVSKDIRGKYFAPIAQPCEPSDHAANTKLQKDLWDFTAKLIEQKKF